MESSDRAVTFLTLCSFHILALLLSTAFPCIGGLAPFLLTLFPSWYASRLFMVRLSDVIQILFIYQQSLQLLTILPFMMKRPLSLTAAGEICNLE